MMIACMSAAGLAGLPAAASAPAVSARKHLKSRSAETYSSAARITAAIHLNAAGQRTGWDVLDQPGHAFYIGAGQVAATGEVWEASAMAMVGLYLVIRSFADMTMDRAVAIARAFDAHPSLRPVRVGGDRARIKVEPTMEALFVKHGLPIGWGTVRRGHPNHESGDINLLPGRGGWFAIRDGDVWKDEPRLTGHEVEQYWLADVLGEPAEVVEVAALFEELVIAADAAYAYAEVDTGQFHERVRGIEFRLPGVFWLNYFGPAFLASRPGLSTASGSCTLPTGGVLVRATENPWEAVGRGVPAWQEPLRAILGEQAFLAHDDPNPCLPAISEHVVASPGTMEMPWVAWQRERAIEDQGKKHASAQRRLANALAGREEPVLPVDAVEWSTSFDLPDWQDFAKYLTRKLRGDLSTAVGKAMFAVIATAPIDEEDGILLDTRLGIIRLHWFIDDVGTVDAYIFGSSEVHDLCQQWWVE
jgi:hypothetical protein